MDMSKEDAANFKKMHDDIINLAVWTVKVRGKSIEDAINIAATKCGVNAEDYDMESLMKKVYYGTHEGMWKVNE